MNDALESLYNVISSKQKPSLVFGYARIEEVDKNTNINTENSYNTDNNKTTTTNNNTANYNPNTLVGKQFEYYQLIETNSIHLSSVLHHKSLFDFYGAFDCHIAMRDSYVWDLWLRWAKAVPFIFVDKVISVIDISNAMSLSELNKTDRDKNAFRILSSKERNEGLKPEYLNGYEIDNLEGYSKEFKAETYFKQILPWGMRHKELITDKLSYYNESKIEVILVTKATFDSTIDITIMNFKELLKDRYHFIYIPSSQLNNELLLFVDAVIFHRTCDLKSNDFMKECKKKGIPVLYLLDDDLLNIYKLGDEFAYLAPGTVTHNALIYQIKNADAVISYSTSISQTIMPYNKRVLLLKTNILSRYICDNNLLQIKEGNKENGERIRTKTIKIAFIGGNAREEELEFIWEDLLYISEKYKDKVEFYFWGYIPEKINQISKSKVYTSEFTTSYYEYLSRLFEFVFDIVISPLFEKIAKIAKCPIKYLEATVSGAVGIYSDVIPYEDVRDGINGIKAKNIKGEWRKKLEMVIEMDKNCREEIVQNARNHIMKQYTTESQIELFEAAIQSGILHSRIGNGTVLYVVHSGYLGGAENHLLRHALLTKENHFDVWVCIPLYFKGKKERVEQICIENGIKVHYVNYSIYTDVASIDTERAILESKAFVKLALQYKVRLFHSDTLIPAAQIASHELNIPHIASVYTVDKARLTFTDNVIMADKDEAVDNSLKNNEPTIHVTLKHILPKYIHSDSVHYANIWHEGIGAERRCIRGWIPKAFFDKGEYRLELNQSFAEQQKSSLVFGVCGTVQERKGQHKLIEAVGILKQKGLEVRLNIIGYNHFFPNYMESCQSIIQKYQIEDQIFFIGFVPQPDEELSRLDALVCAGDWESFPQAILEAMAMRIPVISTPVGGVPELIMDRITGYLAKGYEVENLVEIISDFIHDYENNYSVVSNIVDNAFSAVFKECNEHYVTKELFKYYNDIITN